MARGSKSASTLSYLYSLQWRGMKLGLRNIRALMRYAGHPERRFRSIHVAGTNGKGSTASFLASTAMEAGYKTGLYTSPHLVRFHERIKINGEELSDEGLVYYIEALRPAIEASRATFFEATTAVAFLYFADEHVDLAVIETGMGGRFDATNILIPLISVITNVSFDHTEHLGDTLPKIAYEKGGIIKAGVPVVTGAEGREVLDVFRSIARRRNSSFYPGDELAPVVPAGRRGMDAAVRFTAGYMRGQMVVPGLSGAHQVANARLAVAAYEALKRTGKNPLRRITRAATVRGLRNVRRNTRLHGRLEVVRWRGKFLLDVAHNPAGIKTLVSALPRGAAKPKVAVFGVMKDKEYRAMLKALAGIIDTLVLVAPKTERALPVHALVREASKNGIKVRRGGNVGAGLAKARRIAGPAGTVLVTGSHYVVGEALDLMQNRT